MSKKVYSINLDEELVTKFKDNNFIKLSTFLNEKLNNFVKGQQEAINFSTTDRDTKILSKKIDTLVILIDKQIEMNQRELDLCQGNDFKNNIQ